MGGNSASTRPSAEEIIAAAPTPCTIRAAISDPCVGAAPQRAEATVKTSSTAARALEVIGETWSLLIVRNLVAAPRGFSDLRRSLASITPKWLSQRLRELEEAGVVQRDAAGRREDWYSLAPKEQAVA